MTWLQLWTMELTATVALCVLLAVAEDSGLPVAAAEILGPADIVKKESHPVLFRQKREWIWNSLYVQEENRVRNKRDKIGQLRSSVTVDVKRFEIFGEGAGTIFEVDDKNGDLFVTRALDREMKSSYKLHAKLFDGSGNMVENPGSFVVQVTDINDNRPFFNTTFTGQINERSPEGTEVIRVIAYDADDPTTANADLGYMIKDDKNNFRINEVTGWISCNNKDLDREDMSQYVVVVYVKDMREFETGSTASTSVTINIEDINDNLPSFPRQLYRMSIPEDYKPGERIEVLEVEDRDSKHNKNPVFTIRGNNAQQKFDIVLNQDKDGSIILKEPLDYETTSSYKFIVDVTENVVAQADNQDRAVTSATVLIEVTDVNEPPVFGRQSYSFTVEEERIVDRIGRVTATDPDSAKQEIRYSIIERDCPISINPTTGELSTLHKLDREQEEKHKFRVKAQEVPNGLESFVEVTITVKDINDNKPQLVADDIILCDGDAVNTVVGVLRATDEDIQNTNFTFTLATESSNFSIRDNGDNTADVILKMGPFSMDDPKDYSVDVIVSDGHWNSNTRATIKSCRCAPGRKQPQCKASARRMGVSVHALIAILLCILTILVIVILFVMRKRYQKDSLASMKNSGEIHEQLVTYDEEGGGEMDTNGYDVSILSSACHDGSLLRHPAHHPHPSLYAMVQKAPQHSQPTACKGDMAVMIEVKKEEADHDRDGFPYDTLHIYGYEGPESLAGSLSSLDSSSTGSNLDYDFLNDWGPRFRTLAELYGVDEPEYYHQY